MPDKRVRTKRVRIGRTAVGGDEPIRVQSMLTQSPDDIDSAVAAINDLAREGCEIVRIAVPHLSDVQHLKEIRAQITVPLVADIHFNYKIAVAAVEAGVDKIRVNPGNIGGKAKFHEVCRAAQANGIPIRIGVNAGSLEQDLREKFGGRRSEALVESVLRYVAWAEDAGMSDLVLSAKSSDVPTTCSAYRELSRRTDYPLHVGVTEAGTKWAGAIRSAVGIGTLLAAGIGDTLRVSLTADPVLEVRAAWEILSALELRKRGPVIISCPTCGRCQVNLLDIAERVEQALRGIKRPLKVAVMGCVVNGPGEAEEADIGVACGRGSGVLFKDGKIIARFREEELADAVLREVNRLIQEE